MFLRVVLFGIILAAFTSSSFSQITESFEGWTDGTYGTVSSATLASGDWETNNSLVGTSNPRTGSRCVRFNDDSGANEYLEYQGTDGNGKDNGLGTVSFWYRHWDGDGSTVQFQVQYNQSGGGWTNIGGVVTVNSTTYTQFSSTPNISGDDILIRVLSISDDERMCIDDFEMYDYVAACTPAAEPTTSSSSLSFPNTNCSSITLNWTSGNGSNRIVVASTNPIAGTPTDQTNYGANSIFGLGGTIAANEYVVYSGTGNSATVTGLSASTTYYFVVFEYNGTNPNCTENYLTSSNLSGNETTIACTNSEITGILVDACGGNEGIDEFFTFTNGTSDLDMSDFKVDFPNGETYCNSGCATKTWVTNATFTTQLNDTAGCAGLFVEADPIPANANVIVFTGSSPSHDFDFSGLCGTGPYYAVYANNTNTGGRFGNYNSDCSQYRTLVAYFGGGDSDTATYQRCSLSNTDGDYVGFDAAGNPTYANDGCTPIATLPIELLNFYGKKSGAQNILYWSTSTEINNDYFTLEKSEDALYFEVLGYLNGAGTSNVELNYQLIDYTPYETTYYRLKQTDFDGNYSYSETIALHRKSNGDFYFSNTNNTLIVSTSSDNEFLITIYNLQGQLIKQVELMGKNETQIPLNLNNGVYIVSLQSNNEKIVSKKIVITE